MSLPSPITFLPIEGVVPCQPYTFTFSYKETDGAHVVGTTNTFSAWVSDAISGKVLPTLSNGGVVYDGYWQVGWNPVIASAGEYAIAAAVLSNSNITYTTSSQLFTIESGSDESCVHATTAEGPITLVLSSDAATATGTAIGASFSSTEGTHLARGAIAGLAIGVIVILFTLLAAIIFVRRRRSARAVKAQAPQLPTYATLVRVGSLRSEKDEKDMDSKSVLGPTLAYDQESMRSVPPAYHHGDV